MNLKEIASQAIGAKGHVELVCSKCTKTEVILAGTEMEAMRAAVIRGWVGRGGAMVCKKCPSSRESNG